MRVSSLCLLGALSVLAASCADNVDVPVRWPATILAAPRPSNVTNQIRYLVLAAYDSDVVLVPGYYNEPQRAFTPWDDVLLTRAQLPDWSEVRHLPGAPFISRGVELRPAVAGPLAVTRRITGDSQMVQVGYWDHHFGFFITWAGLTEQQWTQYHSKHPNTHEWIEVAASSVQRFASITVPPAHASIAREMAALTDSNLLQVGPDIEILKPIEVIRAPGASRPKP